MRNIQLACSAFLALSLAVSSAPAQTPPAQVGQTSPTAPMPTSESTSPVGPAAPAAPAAPAPAASLDEAKCPAAAAAEPSKASSNEVQLAKIQADVAALRSAMAELLAAERREASTRVWVTGMEAKRSHDHLGTTTAVMVAGALATGLLSWAMVRTDYATAPLIMASLSAVLTTAAAIKVGKLVHVRRAITREIRVARPH